MGFVWIFLSFLLYQGTSAVDTESVSVIVKEGDSVTLNTGVIKNQNNSIKWYYNDIRIALINGDPGKTCTDVQCKERFRDRLKLDPQTGSLTIMNIRNTDSGEYKLTISSNGSNREKIFSVSVHDPDPDSSPGSGLSSGVVAGIVLLVFCWCLQQLLV